MLVKEVRADQTHGIRHKILRPHQTIDDCRYDTDHDPGAFHLGAYEDNIIFSVASFYKERSVAFESPTQYRLRGMATLVEYRARGAGRSLIDFAVDRFRLNHVDLLWCNARTSAALYYSRLGFKQQGEIFDLPPLGPHKLMYLNLF